MNIPIRNVYYLLCYAWGHVGETDLVDRNSLGRFERVQDLLGKVLAEGTFRLVRRGLDRGYREVTAEIGGVRGRLEIATMAKTAVRSRSRTICTFDELSADVLHNRILRSTLDALLRTGQLDASVGRDVALARDKLGDVTPVRMNARMFRKVRLNRNQRFYRFLLSVCQLVQGSMLIDEQTGAVRFRDFRADEARMWKVFEDFVLQFFRIEQADYQVSGQTRLAWDTDPVGVDAVERYLPAMHPDIVLESSGRRIILDTKYYSSPLSHHWGTTKLRSENLYQLLTYLENRQAGQPTGVRHEGVLLYAAVGERLRIDLSVRGYRIQARTVDLSRPWSEIHAELLEAID